MLLSLALGANSFNITTNVPGTNGHPYLTAAALCSTSAFFPTGLQQDKKVVKKKTPKDYHGITSHKRTGSRRSAAVTCRLGEVQCASTADHPMTRPVSHMQPLA